MLHCSMWQPSFPQLTVSWAHEATNSWHASKPAQKCLNLLSQSSPKNLTLKNPMLSMGSHRREPRQQPGGGRLTRPSLGRLWSCVRSFRLMPELQVEFFVIRYCWIFSNYNLFFIDGILTQYFEGEDGVSRGILFGDLFNIYNSISNKVNILIKLTQIKGNLKCKRISLVITVHLCLSGWLQLFKTDKMNDPLSGGGGMGWETAYTVVPSKQSCFDL